MTTRIVHFGEVDWPGLSVLACNGFMVDACGTSVPKLHDMLLAGEIGAVAFTECGSKRGKQAITIARSLSPAPLVLFECARGECDTSQYDLVIPQGTRPPDWIEKVDELLKRSRKIQAESKSIREESAAMREKSATLREQSASERERAARARSNPR